MSNILQTLIKDWWANWQTHQDEKRSTFRSGGLVDIYVQQIIKRFKLMGSGVVVILSNEPIRTKRFLLLGVAVVNVVW